MTTRTSKGDSVERVAASSGDSEESTLRELDHGEPEEDELDEDELDEDELDEDELDEDELDGRSGFTLLEVLIALAIFGVALSSLLTSQMEAMRATAYSRGLTASSALAEYQLIEIEYQMRKDGWVQNDVEFEGDFDDHGWPDIEYKCLVDFIELPEYNELVAAQEASDEASGEDDMYQDSGEQAFGMLGMVWPMIKAAIENSIRRAECTVFWSDGKTLHDYDVETYWVDINGLNELPGLGGEYTDEDDPSGNEPAGGGGGSSSSGSAPRGPKTTVPSVTSMSGGGKG
jgi:prepilin-type N-terminal cleavage/methylation domain-containing protein